MFFPPAKLHALVTCLQLCTVPPSSSHAVTCTVWAPAVLFSFGVTLFRKQADLEAILATAREIAAGMAYLHADNILHGDLTAGNILLVSSPKDRRQFSAKVKLCWQ